MQAPRAVDRQLRRRGPGQQVGGGDGVLEVVRLEPPAPVDAEVSQQRDVGRWAAEADAADPAPFLQDRQQRRPGRLRLFRRAGYGAAG